MVPGRSFVPEDWRCPDELSPHVSLNTASSNICVNQNAFDEDHILSPDQYEWHIDYSTSTISALLHTSTTVSSKFDRPSCASNSNRDVLSALRSSLQCLSVPVTSGDQEGESHNSSEEAHLSPRGHQQCPGTPTGTYGVLLRDCLEKPSRQTFVGIGDSPQIAKLQIGVVSRVWLQNLLAGLQRLTNADAVPKSGATCTVTCGNSSPLNPISGTDRPGFTREHRATGTTKTRRSASSRRASPMSHERFVPLCNTSQLNSKFPIFVPVDYKSAHGVTRPFRLRPESNSGIRSSKQLSRKPSSNPRTIYCNCSAIDRDLRPMRGCSKPSKPSAPSVACPLITVTNPAGHYAEATIDAM